MASQLLWILPTFIGKVPLPESRNDLQNEVDSIDLPNFITDTHTDFHKAEDRFDSIKIPH